MNIYVGNISYDANEDQLREIFEPHGKVDSVTIIRDKYSGKSKGFGFIEMPELSEAEEAISNLDGHDLLGRPLKVNKARPRRERRGGGGRGGGRY